MSQQHHVRGSGKAIKFLISDLPPIYGKNPWIAGVLGFLFGGIGLGLYFQSWKDFIYPILIFLIIVISFGAVIPIIGAVPGGLFGALASAGWGIWRAWP